LKETALTVLQLLLIKNRVTVIPPINPFSSLKILIQSNPWISNSGVNSVGFGIKIAGVTTASKKAVWGH